MRPLLYSEYDAHNRHIGWSRTGHHISYSRNVMHLHCPLLTRGSAFYELEWQMVGRRYVPFLSVCLHETQSNVKMK